MYTSLEDARSDLFLAGAVFVFGGLIFEVLLNIVPLHRIPVLGYVILILLPLATTVLVPYLLIRYRGEPWAMYGLSGLSLPALGYGAALGLVLVGAFVLVAVLSGLSPTATVPLADVSGSGPLALLRRISQWLGFGLLAVYGTVKARDAFHGTPQRLREGAVHLARILSAVVAVAGGLLVLAMAARNQLALAPALEVVLPALAVVGIAALVTTRVQGSPAATRPVLITPAVLLGLGAFRLGFDAVAFVSAVYLGAVFALLGLVVGVLQETQRSAWAAVGLALVIAVFTVLGEGAALR